MQDIRSKVLSVCVCVCVCLLFNCEIIFLRLFFVRVVCVDLLLNLCLVQLRMTDRCEARGQECHQSNNTFILLGLWKLTD